MEMLKMMKRRTALTNGKVSAVIGLRKGAPPEQTAFNQIPFLHNRI
jgi:hypothetical protein